MRALSADSVDNGRTIFICPIIGILDMDVNMELYRAQTAQRTQKSLSEKD